MSGLICLKKVTASKSRGKATCLEDIISEEEQAEVARGNAKADKNHKLEKNKEIVVRGEKKKEMK